MASVGWIADIANTGAHAMVTAMAAIQKTQRRHQPGVWRRTTETNAAAVTVPAQTHGNEMFWNPCAGRARQNNEPTAWSTRSVTPKAAMHRHTASEAAVIAQTACATWATGRAVGTEAVRVTSPR